MESTDNAKRKTTKYTRTHYSISDLAMTYSRVMDQIGRQNLASQ